MAAMLVALKAEGMVVMMDMKRVALKVALKVALLVGKMVV